jgi:hypothetical protein
VEARDSGPTVFNGGLSLGTLHVTLYSLHYERSVIKKVVLTKNKCFSVV